MRVADGVDLEQIAGLTTGFTGADFANLINEAAIMATMKQLILSIYDSNMTGDFWRWNFRLERNADGAHALSCKQIIEDDPLEPVTDLRTGEDIYDALCSILDSCGCYHLGDYNISAIAERISQLDAAIVKEISEPSEPALTSEQERDFYRRVGGGLVTILRPAPQKPSAPPKKSSRRRLQD